MFRRDNSFRHDFFLAVAFSYDIFTKVKVVIKRLKQDGWYLKRIKGSHHQFKHPTKLGTVTVSGKLSKDVPLGTLKNIWKQAEIEED